MAATKLPTTALYIVPDWRTAGALNVGLFVVPYKILYDTGAVPVCPAVSNVTVIEFDVGVPDTIGTAGADGATAAAPVDIEALTADVVVPSAFDACDLK